jgi:hypothetical protein
MRAGYKTVVFTYPSIWASAIVNHDYSGLDKEDIKILNNQLLDDEVSFCDCVAVSDEYTKLVNGMWCMVADFTFLVKG